MRPTDDRVVAVMRQTLTLLAPDYDQEQLERTLLEHDLTWEALARLIYLDGRTAIEASPIPIDDPATDLVGPIAVSAALLGFARGLTVTEPT